jgi:hypothetical protein
MITFICDIIVALTTCVRVHTKHKNTCTIIATQNVVYFQPEENNMYYDEVRQCIQYVPRELTHISIMIVPSLKVQMHEIFIVCFYTFFCIFHSLIETKRSTANIFEKNSENLHRYSKFPKNSLFSPKARSMAERCRRKRDVKLSAFFVTVSFRIVLSVLGEKAESNFAFSVKALS